MRLIVIAIALTLVIASLAVGWAATPPANSPAAVTAAAAGKVMPIRSAAELDVLLARTEGEVVLDFSATWCGPCRQLAPQLEAFATDHPATTVVVIDVDEVAELAQRYAIEAMPTLIHVRGGKEVKRSLGYRDAAAIAAWLTSGT